MSAMQAFAGDILSDIPARMLYIWGVTSVARRRRPKQRITRDSAGAHEPPCRPLYLHVAGCILAGHWLVSRLCRQLTSLLGLGAVWRALMDEIIWNPRMSCFG